MRIAEAETNLTFGPYVTAGLVGQGAMGAVYEARHPDQPVRYALKAMHGSLTGDPLAIARFLREAQTLAEVSHPHIVRIENSGIESGRPYIVMEFIDGESLSGRLARDNRLEPAQIAELFLPILSAVAALHDQRIVHRDLKPANVMLRRTETGPWHPVLLDFGISRLDEATFEVDLTRSEALIGTLQYLSPEQLRNAKWASQLSDQYALGVMLYECATGRRPFAAASQYDLMHAIVTGPVTAPSAFAPQLPMAFETLVLRAMSREPGRRFSSVRALGSALLSFADKATWVRWRDEFTGGMDSSDANKVPPGATERDVPRPSAVAAAGVVSGTASPPQRRGGATGMAVAIVGALVVAAGAVIAITATRESPSSPPSTLNAAPPPAAAPAPAPAAAAPAPAPVPAPVVPAVVPASGPPDMGSAPPPQAAEPARVRRGTKSVKRLAGSPTSSPRSKNEELGDDDVFDPFPPR